MGNQWLDGEDIETLYALYLVQSPTTASYTNSHIAVYDVPHHTESLPLHMIPYSSPRSNDSYLQEKNVSYYEHQPENDDNRLIDDESDDDNECEDEEEKGWESLLSFSTYPNSTIWICLQIFWRLIVSLGVALLVFYIATKPPPPHVSIEIAKVREFGLGEGADASGVTTKLFTINCSMNLSIKNKSQFFSLHIQSTAITMSFGHLPLAISYEPSNIYALSDGLTTFELILATRNKPVYGGGRDMQDMIDMDKGVPLLVKLRMRSYFGVVWGLIIPKFYHKAECLLLLGKGYDKIHHTQIYKSGCLVSS